MEQGSLCRAMGPQRPALHPSPRLPSRLPLRRRQQRGGRQQAAPTQAAALPMQLVGAAAKAAAAVPSLVQATGASLAAAVDPGVLGATVSASGKLLIICGAVGWLLRTGRIPNSTATIMSQISFQLLIPCMLFSKVAATLAVAPDTTLLLGIAGVAIFQICVGAACGLALGPLLGLKRSGGNGGGSNGSGSRGSGSSWQGRSSPDAAAAIALSMAAASGAPQAAAALRPRPSPSPAGPAQLVAASAAFGNSFTLPAVFLTTLLPAPLASRALGYAALFLLAWSPCLWSIGMALITGKQQQPQRRQQQAGSSGGGNGSGEGQAGSALQQQDGSESTVKPLTWRQPRVVDVTPLAVSSSTGSGSGSSTMDSLDAFASGTTMSSMGSSGGSSFVSSSRSSRSSMDDAAQLEPPSWAQQLAQHPLTNRLTQFGSQVLNPPVLAILAGTLVGLTPAGRALLIITQSNGAAAAAGASAAAGSTVAALPPELGLLHAVVKAALEVIELLAAGTLATQTLVLAASLLQQPESKASAAASVPVGPAASATAAAATSLHRRGWVAALKQLLPSNAEEGRALAVLALTRFLVVPLATIALLQTLAAGGLLPPAMSDPVLLFVLLVEAVMPSAQNLIILLQLSERTQAQAPGFARMLLKQYFYAIIPVTLWVSSFATNLQIPVLR